MTEYPKLFELPPVVQAAAPAHAPAAVAAAPVGERVLLVDATNLAHRAWHTMQGRVDGPFVTHGIITMIATAHTVLPWTRVVACYDHIDNARKEIWPEYKANRSAKDPELYTQMDRSMELLTAAGITVVQTPGWEADDLIASGCQHATADLPATVLTGDRDLLAQVAEHVKVLRITTSIREATAFDPENFVVKYGITPAQYVEYAALRGDTSDNLPGVPGIGEKTASKLLGEYGTVAAAISSGRLAPKMQAKLEEHRAAFERNVAVMTPKIDLPVPYLDAPAFDADLAYSVLEEAGLRASAARISAITTGAPRPSQPVEPASVSTNPFA